MDPISIISQGAKLNPAFTRVAIGVAVILAVLAIGKGYFGDDWMTPLYGGIAVFLGMVLVVIISTLTNVRGLETTVVWFVRAILLAVVILLFSALTYAVAGYPADFPCTIRFNTSGCSRLVSAPPEAGPQADAGLPPVADAAEEIRAGYTVYVQFAGYRREVLNEMADQIRAKGWKVPGLERLGSAAGLREIRYRSDEDKPAADLLAADLAASGLPNMKVRKVGIIAERTVEVWVGQT